MPTYVYEVVNDDGTTGERFEVVQRMTGDPLTEHPETGEAVQRVFVPFHVAGKHAPMKTDRNLADNKKLERLGFTKYEKAGDGKYEKVLGKGPKSIQK